MSELERILHNFRDSCETGGDKGSDITETTTKIIQWRKKWALRLLEEARELNVRTFNVLNVPEIIVHICKKIEESK